MSLWMIQTPLQNWEKTSRADQLGNGGIFSPLCSVGAGLEYIWQLVALSQAHSLDSQMDLHSQNPTVCT